jgi:hypothetical protein
MFSKDKTPLQDKIRAKTDRELQEDIAYFSNENEKHLRRISGNLSFFFWLTIIGIVLYLVMMGKAGADMGHMPRGY